MPVDSVSERPFRSPATDTDVAHRLMVALAEAIKERGYKSATVADVVRIAKMSRRAFYAHFTGKEDCYIALMTLMNNQLIERIGEAVDRSAPWRVQVRQAIDGWLRASQSEPTISLSWIRDSPALGAAARGLQQRSMEAFIGLVHALVDTPQVRAEGLAPPSRAKAIVLIGGLRELIATQVENGRAVTEIGDEAVSITMAILTASNAR